MFTTDETNIFNDGELFKQKDVNEYLLSKITFIYNSFNSSLHFSFIFCQSCQFKSYKIEKKN